MKTLLSLLFPVFLLVCTENAAAEMNKSHTPKVGSQERTMILNAVRKELRISNQFAVLYLKAKNDLAYFAGNVIYPSEDTNFDLDRVRALIEKQPSGGWKVLEIWTLEKEDASAQQRRAFNQRVRERLQDKKQASDIFDENI